MNDNAPVLGFIGLGVMGGPMCQNMARKHSAPVHAYDTDAAALEGPVAAGALEAKSMADVAAASDIVFLSLPGGKQVHDVCLGEGGIASAAKRGTVVVDLSTTGVADARSVAGTLAEKGILFADAPVARTREAAQNGTLAITVGASADLFARIEPLLRHMGTEITHCGDIGCGQVLKLINNTLVFAQGAALAEMMVVGERAGVEPETLLRALSNGSGDSFVLRNHGMKAMLPRVFPEKAFPVPYAMKDLNYSIELAESCGVEPRLPKVVKDYFEAAIGKGYSENYWPVIVKLVDEE